jgi:uncharacterized membrane protein YkvA (DUF1232 family)
MNTSNYIPDDNFWNHIRRFLGQNPAIIEVAAAAFAVLDEKTPLHAKIILGGALLYFVTPLDAIPDPLPPGLADDLALFATAMYTIGSGFVTDGHRCKARQFFGQHHS